MRRVGGLQRSVKQAVWSSEGPGQRPWVVHREGPGATVAAIVSKEEEEEEEGGGRAKRSQGKGDFTGRGEGSGFDYWKARELLG